MLPFWTPSLCVALCRSYWMWLGESTLQVLSSSWFLDSFWNHIQGIVKFPHTDNVDCLGIDQEIVMYSSSKLQGLIAFLDPSNIAPLVALYLSHVCGISLVAKIGTGSTSNAAVKPSYHRLERRPWSSNVYKESPVGFANQEVLNILGNGDLLTICVSWRCYHH